MSEEEIKKLVLEFHNTYEKLSNEYNYETRKDTRQFDFNSPNGKLMYSVIRKVVVPKIQQKENIIKEVREKVDNFDVFKEFTFPLMKRDEEQQVKSSIDYEWRKSIKEPILEILEKENNR